MRGGAHTPTHQHPHTHTPTPTPTHPPTHLYVISTTTASPWLAVQLLLLAFRVQLLRWVLKGPLMLVKEMLMMVLVVLAAMTRLWQAAAPRWTACCMRHNLLLHGPHEPLPHGPLLPPRRVAAAG
jgi:hypothetical protein